MSWRIETSVPADYASDRTPVARYTLVAFHAHPDDEVLFTGGTLARASAEGHRVDLVTATSGDLGLAASGTRGLGALRGQELQISADALGVDRLVMLGYGDSGMDPLTPPPGATPIPSPSPSPPAASPTPSSTP